MISEGRQASLLPRTNMFRCITAGHFMLTHKAVCDFVFCHLCFCTAVPDINAQSLSQGCVKNVLRGHHVASPCTTTCLTG